MERIHIALIRQFHRMSNKQNKFSTARAVESKLEEKIQKALRECGMSEESIGDFIWARHDQPESILPESEREIEWRIGESRRIAKHFGLHIPNLTD